MGCVSSKSGGGSQEKGVVDAFLDEDLQFEFQKLQNVEQTYYKSEQKQEKDEQMFEQSEQEQLQQFMATKPWLGQLVGPSSGIKQVQDFPIQSLHLKWVNGFKCEDARQTVFLSGDGKSIYFGAGAIIVKQSLGENRQEFLGVGEIGKDISGHNDDIESMSISQDRKMLASGQRGKNPKIIIWDLSGQGSQYCSFFQGVNTRSAKQVKFSQCGKYLFSVDQSNEHSIHVFGVAQKKKITAKSLGQDVVFDLTCNLSSTGGAVATKRGIIFFSFDGATINTKRGILGSKGVREDIITLAYLNNEHLLSGTVGGNIIVWNQNQAILTFKADQSFISQIYCSENYVFYSANNSKTLNQLKKEDVLQGQGTNLVQQVKIEGAAQSIDTIDEKQILVATKNGKIFFVSQKAETTLLQQTHFTGETWGIAVTDTHIVTSGDDNQVLVYDAQSYRLIGQTKVNEKAGKKQQILGASTLSKMPPNQQARAVAVNPKNNQIAIATNEGEVIIKKSPQEINTEISRQQVGKEWIECMQYSPNGKLLAVGNHDNNIYILDAENNYKILANCNKNNSFITALDWTQDSQNIRTNSGSYELLFFSALNGQQITSGATQFRDEKWATSTCKIQWAYQGIYPPETDGSHINGVDCTKNGKLAATGDDWGLINLFNCPNVKGSKAKSYRAHCSHVVRVLFDSQDKHLYSVGGYDKTFMVWSVQN